LLFGLLVPDSDRDDLARQFGAIAAEHGMAGFIHATKLHRQEAFSSFASSLVNALAASSMVSFVMRYEGDLHSALPDAARDAYAANRHLNMAQAAFEYLLFLYPEFWGENLIVDFHPNSRTLPAKDDVKALIFKDMGFEVHGKNENRFVPVWTAGAIRAYLHRMLIDYSPWLHKTGQRSWTQVEAIVAKKSDDPFVHWTDNLAWLARWGESSDRYSYITDELSKVTAINLSYGREHQDFRAMTRLYLDGDLEEFLSTAMTTLPTFRNVGYRNNLVYMLDTFIVGTGALDAKQLTNLEHLANEYLRSARGNWDFVFRLLSRLTNAIDSLPEAERETREMRRLLARLHSHLISVYNHRGDTGRAWQSFKTITKLALTPETVAEFHEQAELLNRLAVTSANVFAFEASNRELQPLAKALEESQAPLNIASQTKLAYPLLGKLWGTMGQNFAFLAPRMPDCFPTAEALFLKARNSFTIPRDRLRHEVNLLHLYLDWEKTDATKRNDADAAAKRIEGSPAVAAFLAKPDTATAFYNQFNLAVLIKHACQRGNNLSELIGKYRLDSLKRWFGIAANEHPFEFICGGLGLGALSLGRRQDGMEYLTHALTIPGTDKPEEEPTLQILRCQIVVRWAMIEKELDNKTDVSGKLKVAINLLGHISQTSGLETMLRLKDDEEPTGWFASGWQALSAVDWEKEFSREACEVFLNCFTFNYR
jgi:hypothetical protein